MLNIETPFTYEADDYHTFKDVRNILRKISKNKQLQYIESKEEITNGKYKAIFFLPKDRSVIANITEYNPKW